MTSLILSYTNPDLDGVACAMALQEMEGPPWQAAAIGELDAETFTVLQLLGLSPPLHPPEWSAVVAIWLVDTHHPNQLPDDLPNERVVRVTDHHPGGEPGRYLAALIQNESVGAAATLVAEQFLNHARPVPAHVAQLLQAAILSNTLEFRAPATCSRDHQAFAALEAIAPLPADVAKAMRIARGSKIALATLALLQADLKVFNTQHGRVAIAQVEAEFALDVLTRHDLSAALNTLEEIHQAQFAMVNLVDLAAGRSAIVASGQAIIQTLAAVLHYPVSDGVINADRLLQRKTDIVPHLA